MSRYQVLIAEDEPAAAAFIAKIMELKCPDYEVIGLAEDGRAALELLEKTPVDVVISDVRMPGMDGIELAQQIRDRYPDIRTVIVSGHQEFEYAKGALRAGVEDYLLKPLDPQEVQALFEKIGAKLRRSYWQRRNRVLHLLSEGAAPADEDALTQLFPGHAWNAAIIRKNSVISRFGSALSREIYSDNTENMIIYGRDDMEMLYLGPGELSPANFRAMMDREFEKLGEEGSFLTMVICPEQFAIAQLPEVMQQLYLTLDSSIVIGKDRKLMLGAGPDAGRGEEAAPGGSGGVRAAAGDAARHGGARAAAEDTARAGSGTPSAAGGKTPPAAEVASEEQFNNLLFLLKRREFRKLGRGLEELFALWEAEERTQFWIEGKVRYLFYELRSSVAPGLWNEYWLDDAFSEARTMPGLCANLLEILQPYIDQTGGADSDGKTVVFRDITEYLKAHLSEGLSVQSVCTEIGISQAALSRLFRTYAGVPYKNYLTNLRIETAKAIMQKNPDMFIKDVAESVGFVDQFYFSRVFRSVTGQSPTEFMEAERADG